MIYREKVSVISNNSLTEDIFDLRIKTKDISGKVVPGQFINIYCKDNSRLLPRPISICEVNDCEVRLVYRVVGEGTKEISRLKAGDEIFVTGPVGKGYDVDHINKTFKNAALFGGGAGIPPMIELAKRLTLKTDVFLGYRDVLFLNRDFPENVTVHIATEDGSAGTKGNVMDALKGSSVTPDVICACGPMPMLKAINAFASEKGIKTYFSLEERMACGIGACLGCVCKTKKTDDHSKVDNARVCVDGPVFDAGEVIL